MWDREPEGECMKADCGHKGRGSQWIEGRLDKREEGHESRGARGK